MGEGLPLAVMAKVKHVGVDPPAPGINEEVAVRAERVIGHHPPPNPVPQIIQPPLRGHKRRHAGKQAIGAHQQVSLPEAAIGKTCLHGALWLGALAPAQHVRPGLQQLGGQGVCQGFEDRPPVDQQGGEFMGLALCGGAFDQVAAQVAHHKAAHRQALGQKLGQ